MSRISLFIAFISLFTPLFGADFNIHLFTDSTPDYADLESYTASLTDVWATDQDKSVAVWRYPCRTSHQMSETREKGRSLFDPIMFFNSYPNTYCAFYAAFNTTVWDHMGYKTCYVQLGDHTVSEVSWDNGTSWHLFDSSMRMYCFKHDGVVASCQDIMDADTCSLSEGLGASSAEPGHYYLYHFAKECGTNPVDPIAHANLADPWGYRCGVDNPVPNNRTLRNGADSYTDGFSRETYTTHIRYGFQYNLDLHPHQVYTRYYTELGDTQDYFRITNGSFVGDPNDASNIGTMRGNGRWEFTPDLSTTAYHDVIFDENGLVHASEDGGGTPHIRPAAAGAAGEVVFKVSSASVTTSADVHIEGVRSTGSDALAVAISTDAGMHWTTVYTASATGAIDTDIHLDHTQVGGAFQYLVKVGMTAAALNTNCGLNAIGITTITQLNRYTLPKLVRGNNRIHFRLGEQTENLMLWPALHNDQYTATVDSSANIWTDTTPYNFYKASVRPVLGNTDTHLTWKFTAPSDITRLVYGGEFCKRSGAADTCFVRLHHAFDGSTFTQDADFSESADPFNEMVYADVTLAAGQREVWLKYELRHNADQTYNSTGISDALMYVYYTPRSARFQPVEVTFNWTEHRGTGDVTREHTALMNVSEMEWEINTAGIKDPTMNWVRINLKGYGPAAVYGYSDGQDVGTGADYDKVKYDWNWNDNAAFHKTYTVSRPADGSNPDTGGTELADGNICPPTAYRTSASAQELTASWAGDTAVTVTIDLGSSTSIAAFRITTHQPGADYCHPQTIAMAMSTDGVNFTTAGTINHDDIWNPPGNYLPWEQDQSLGFVSLPAGGRLTYPFWLVPAAPVNGRYVRCTFNPQTGKGVGISEIQAFTAITVTDWPDREISLPTATNLDAGAINTVPSNASAGDDIAFSIAPSGGIPGYTYDWDFGDTATSAAAAPVHPFSMAGTFTVSVVVTDTAGRSAYAEVLVIVTDDTDSDGMSDQWEIDTFGDLTHDGTGDGDSDGLTDLQEYQNGADPEDPDTDDDGLNDGDEVLVYGSDPADDDSDGDTLPDGWEVANGLDPADSSDSTADNDSDGYNNLVEYINGTDPNVFDEGGSSTAGGSKGGCLPGHPAWLPLLLLAGLRAWQCRRG